MVWEGSRELGEKLRKISYLGEGWGRMQNACGGGVVRSNKVMNSI